jgi:hypothetical protein
LKKLDERCPFPIAAAQWTLPVVVAITLYWPAHDAAYRLDDFAWLSLRNTIAHGRSLLWALFSPQAQGTMRPLGERLWFLLASSWFGLNPVPLHVLALCAQTANVVLTIDTGRRLLGSRKAAAIAASLWVINDMLAEPMVWISASNEVLYTLWFLAAFNAWLRWIDSRRMRWLSVHVLAVVLAFGTLELAVTLPVVIVLYLLLFRRRLWKTALPSLIVAGLFVTAHLIAVPLPESGPYKLFVGTGLLGNFLRYWANVLGPEEYGRIHQASVWVTRLGTALMSGAILAWLTIGVRRRRWISLFCMAWFLATLAPALPLLDHFTPYYTFVPSIGLAWLAGDALVRIRSRSGRGLAWACAMLYVVCHIPSTLFVRDWNRDRSREVIAREIRLAEAVQDIRRVQPDGAVFLTGLDMNQFWWGLCYGALTRRGFTDLHVLPDAGEHGIPIPPKEWCYREDFQFSREETARMLATGRAHVYDITKTPPGAPGQ